MNIEFLRNLDDTGRHNLILRRCDPNDLNVAIEEFKAAGINVLNIGSELSKKLKTLETAKFLTLEAQEYLHELLEKQARHVVPGKPRVVALYNLGILLEPVLKLNAANLLKEISKNIAIVILWDYLVSEGLLHWGIQQEQYHLNLSDIYIAEGSAEYEV